MADPSQRPPDVPELASDPLPLEESPAAIAREEPQPTPLPAIELKLSQASPPTTWRREEIYGDDGR